MQDKDRDDRLSALSNLNKHRKSKKERYIVVDTNSGEIREDKGIYTKNGRKKEGQRFVKVMDDFKELLRQKILSPHDITVATYCFMFTPYNSNVVSDENGLPLSKSELSKVIGMSRNTIDKSLMRLESLGVIELIKVKDTVIIRVFGKYSKRGCEVNNTGRILLKGRKTH